jgi:proteasome lid subunit RPN8/RPN11
MSERRFTVTAAVDRAIRLHGQETYPHECCGALVGHDDRVTDVVALPNTTEEGPRRRFLVRPSDYRDAERRAAELGGELLGFYHSHPDHPARPSQYDLDHAWPTFAYVIVSVAGQGQALGSADLSRQSAEGATADGATAERASAGLPRRSAERAKAGDMTVWYLKDDRSSFDEGTLLYGENTHSDPAPTVHR